MTTVFFLFIMHVPSSLVYVTMLVSGIYLHFVQIHVLFAFLFYVDLYLYFLGNSVYVDFREV